MAGITKVLKSKQVEAGLAIAIQYLREEFPGCDIEIIDSDGPEGVPDRDLRNRLSRSFWIDFQGTRRILFSIELLEALSTEGRAIGLNMLRQLAVAEFIKNSACVPVSVTLQGAEIY